MARPIDKSTPLPTVSPKILGKLSARMLEIQANPQVVENSHSVAKNENMDAGRKSREIILQNLKTDLEDVGRAKDRYDLKDLIPGEQWMVCSRNTGKDAGWIIQECGFGRFLVKSQKSGIIDHGEHLCSLSIEDCFVYMLPMVIKKEAVNLILKTLCGPNGETVSNGGVQEPRPSNMSNSVYWWIWHKSSFLQIRLSDHKPTQNSPPVALNVEIRDMKDPEQIAQGMEVLEEGIRQRMTEDHDPLRVID